jgi:hypothetical protein
MNAFSNTEGQVTFSNTAQWTMLCSLATGYLTVTVETYKCNNSSDKHNNSNNFFDMIIRINESSFPSGKLLLPLLLNI